MRINKNNIYKSELLEVELKGTGVTIVWVESAEWWFVWVYGFSRSLVVPVGCVQHFGFGFFFVGCTLALEGFGLEMDCQWLLK